MIRSLTSKFVCGAFAVALTTSACKSPEPTASAKGEAAETADGTEPMVVAKPVLMEAAKGMVPESPVTGVEPRVEYAAALEPLLDLVPGENDYYIALRDPAALLRLFDAFVGTAAPSVLKRFEDQANVDDALVVLEEVSKLRDALIEAKVDMDKGVVFLEGPGALVYGTASDDPSAIKVALKAVGVKDTDLPPSCVAPTAMPGFAACGDDEALLKALTPGKHGASFAAAFKERLTGFDVEQGNALFRLEGPKGPVLAAVSTPPGRMHVVVSLADVAEELGKYLVAAKPDALGMLTPGAAFIWGKVSLAAFAEQIAQAPGPVKNVTETLTGEMLIGGVQGTAGAVLVGVNDPFPASGLVSLAALQADTLQAELPPGSTVKVEPVDVGGSTTQALHVKFAIDEAGQKMVDALKLEPSAYGFSAGQYAGAVIGASEEAVKTVASYKPKAASMAGVPGNLAAALRSGETAVAFYLPFDALQASVVRETLQAAVASAPGADFADPKLISAAYDAVSPLSSVAMWLTHPQKERVLHISVESFADATTDEGKAALAALGKIIAGADSAATYGALASAYPSSPRALRYKVRAGEIEGGIGPVAMSASFLLGLVAGVTVPAFLKYIDRSRAAAEENLKTLEAAGEETAAAKEKTLKGLE